MITDVVPNISSAEILIVEDKPSLKILSELLTNAGYKVRTASDGELGLRSVQAKKPDLILLDFKLPGMDGVEVCHRLKDNPETCDIPVIFISELGDRQLKVKALEAGAVDYVTKPIDSSEVLARIKTHLSLYSLQRSHVLHLKEIRKQHDNLEVKRVEEALHSEKLLAEEYIDSMPGLFYVFDKKRFVRWNREWCRVTGYNDEELASRYGTDFFEGAGGAEVELVTKDGRRIPYYFTGTHKKLNGRDYLVGLGIDITERKRAEEKLRRSEESLVMAQEAAQVGSWDWNIEEDSLAWSDETFRQFGLVPGEIEPTYEAFERFIHPSDRGLVKQAVEQTLNEDEPYSIDVRMLREDGTVRTMHAHGVVYRNDDGRPIRFVGIQLDITDRKRAEAERKATIRMLEVLNAEGDLRELMQNVLHFMRELSGCEAAGIRLREGDDFPYYTTSGFDDKFVKAEKYLCIRNLYGQIIRDEIGNPIIECMCGNIICGRFDPSLEFFTSYGSFVSNCTTKLLANTTEEDRQARTRNRCNSEGYESVFLVPLRLGSETFGLLQFNDHRKDCFSPDFVAQAERLAANVTITLAQRRAEEKIAASLDEKDVLLREIHHRVKNNMQVIISLLRMYARESDSDQIRSVLEDCRDRVSAMSLIHEALYQSEDLARVDSEPYLTKLCRNLSQVHGASEKGILLTVGKEEVSLGMDQGVAVGMIVSELVSNVFKHAFPEDGQGSVSVDMSHSGPKEVELIVQDDGLGLPPEIDIHNTPSLGLHLAVITATHELGGSIEVVRDGGTRYVIRFEHKDI